MKDFEDVDLTNTDEIYEQIEERRAIIDRLYGEIQHLIEAALSGADQ